MVAFFQQEYLLSDEFIVMYFMSFFVELGQTENNEVPTGFQHLYSHYIIYICYYLLAIAFDRFRTTLPVSLFFVSVFMETCGTQISKLFQATVDRAGTKLDCCQFPAGTSFSKQHAHISGI